ncbi:hypothetical protein BH20CHL6_BH20CHL6_12920 [soil metagenome]
MRLLDCSPVSSLLPSSGPSTDGPSAAGPVEQTTGPLDRPTALGVLERADAFAAQGDFPDAGNLYGRLVGHREAEIHVAGLLGLAEVRYRLDDDAGAVQTWEQATRAPETPLAWRAWKQLAAARVRAGELSGALDAYREAERRAPPEERPEIASRLGWLSKETGNRRASQRYFGRSRMGAAPAPVVTYGILAVTVAIGIATLLRLPGIDVLFGLLLLDKGAVADGELYRLVTVVLVHDSRLPLHLAFNMYALYIVGPIVEALYGRAVFLGAYVVMAAFASTASFLVNPAPAVGASGAVFGLFGMLLVGGRVYKPIMGRQASAMTSQIGVLIVFNLVLGFGIAGFGGRIDNSAHVGGLIAGAWLGLVLRPRGAPTLSDLWQRPGPAGAAPDADRARKQRTDLLLRGGAVALLGVVIAVGLLVGMAQRDGRGAFPAVQAARSASEVQPFALPPSGAVVSSTARSRRAPNRSITR